MKRRKAIRWKNALFLVMLLAVGFLMVGKTGIETEAAMTLTNPRIMEDASMEAGQKVTWDCIWFGSYPQAEVVTSAMRESYTAVDERLLSDGDLVVSDSVYAKLEIAENWDSNNDITLDGVKYRRMRKEDATFDGSGLVGQYQWSNDVAWHYFQYESIKWRILSIEGNQALLLADRVLDNQKYNTAREEVIWKTSTIRSWLNGYDVSAKRQECILKNFLDSAFTELEQSAILVTDHGTLGEQETLDKMFLLSEIEVYGTNTARSFGFCEDAEINDEARQRKSSIYAKAMGNWCFKNDRYKFTGSCRWWLRMLGDAAYNAPIVSYDGEVFQKRSYVGDERVVGVCPALYLNLLSSDLYSYAGTVSSDGTVKKNIALCGASITDTVYTGEAQTPQVIVKDGDMVLKKGVDYTVTFSQNTEAGIARAEIGGMGSYVGSLVKEFSIRKAEQTLKITLSSASIHVGESVRITADGVGAVSYASDNIDIASVNAQGQVTGIAQGAAKITIMAAGDINHNPGSAVLSITVIEKMEGIHKPGDETESGAEDSGNSGKPGSEGNTNTGTNGTSEANGTSGTNGGSGNSSVTDSGQRVNPPSGITTPAMPQTITAASKTVIYKSKPFSLKAKTSGGGKLTYKSSNKKVAVVSAKGKVTVKGYGETKITIKAAAKGKYKEATKKVTIKVVPQAPKFVNTKKSKIKMDKTVSGYEVYFSTRKNFKRIVKKGTFGKNAHRMQMAGLKKNVNYYAKVRAYKKVGKKMYYSAWSKIISLKQ